MNIIKKIYDEYSSIDKLKEKLKAQPYTTLTRISRIGFKTADSIILQLQKENIIDFGYDVKTSPDRCLSCMLYLLEENENEGHTKMNLADLRQQCLKLVPACAEHFVGVIKDENIYYNKENMEVALRATYETEKYIAEYCGDEYNETLKFHYLAYTAIISYYWYVWALYREACGAVMGESLYNWHVMAKKYSKYLVEKYNL